jgi:hypothetical protein
MDVAALLAQGESVNRAKKENERAKVKYLVDKAFGPIVNALSQGIAEGKVVVGNIVYFNEILDKDLSVWLSNKYERNSVEILAWEIISEQLSAMDCGDYYWFPRPEPRTGLTTFQLCDSKGTKGISVTIYLQCTIT